MMGKYSANVSLQQVFANNNSANATNKENTWIECGHFYLFFELHNTLIEDCNWKITERDYTNKNSFSSYPGLAEGQ